jgi:hypothetical protein
MLIHFQIRGEQDWESMGSGLGSAPDHLSTAAIEDLRALHGGTLPAGSYRYFEAHGGSPLSGHFELDALGAVAEEAATQEE